MGQHRQRASSSGRRIDDVELFGLTTPLITTASGAKMGKTAPGAVWLNADRLSPYDYWQFWRNTEDADVGRFLRLFTDLPLDEIARLEAAGRRRDQRGEEGPRQRGDDALPRRKAAAESGRDGAPHLRGRAAPAATCRRSRSAARRARAPAFPLFELLAQAGLASSNGEARRLIQQGGARVNDVVVTDPRRRNRRRHSMRSSGVIKLSAGKKRHALIRAV